MILELLTRSLERLPARGQAAWAAAVLGISSSLAAPPTTQAQAQRPLIERIAAEYVAAYADEDLVALGRLQAEEIVFEDPVRHVVGKDDVAQALAQAFESFEIDGFSIDRWIYSGDEHVLVIGRISLSFAGPVTTRVGGVALGLGLRIQDGLVVHHIDYVDSREFSRQLRESHRGAGP